MTRNESQQDEIRADEKLAPLAVVITELGLVLPVKRASAQAVDRLAPRDRITLKACNDGDIQFAAEFGRCPRAVLRCVN